MNAREFQEQLRQTGEYRTGRVEAGLPTRLLTRTDFGYYLRLIAMVFRSYVNARRGCYDREAWAATSWRTAQIAEAAGGRVEITGFDHVVRVGGPAVIVGNHMSMLETFLLPCILLAAGPVVFVVKRSLVNYPLFGRILRTVGCVQVGRDNPRDDFETVMRDGEAMLREGRSVVVFPQATRGKQVVPETFNSIGVKLARRAGVPVIPLALKTDFQGLGRRIRDFGPLDRAQPIRFGFGPALDSNGNPKAVHEACVRFIYETVSGWQQAQGADGGRQTCPT
jgi:1-acyl-sn-glycerol-3-phosphate acyltransferase